MNAILAAGHLTSLFDARDHELRAQSHPLVGHASLTVTRIAGGIADNVVPDNCEIVLDRRLLPGETLDAALNDLHVLLMRAKRDHGAEAELAAVRTIAGPTETAVDDPLVREAVAISRRHGVTFPQPGGLTGGVRPRPFSRRWRRGHRAWSRLARRRSPGDEYVPKDDLVRAVLIYCDIAAAMMQP